MGDRVVTITMPALGGDVVAAINRWEAANRPVVASLFDAIKADVPELTDEQVFRTARSALRFLTRDHGAEDGGSPYRRAGTPHSKEEA